MAYQIVDWMYANLSEDDFRNKEDLLSAVRAKDIGDGRVLGWSDRSGWFTDVSPQERSMQSRVTDVNERYISRLRSEIDSANEGNIDSISIENSYAPETITTLNDYLDEKKKELAVPIIIEVDGVDVEIPSKFGRGRPKEEIRSIYTSIAGDFSQNLFSATTKEEAESISIPSGIPSSLDSELRRLKRDVVSDLPSEPKPEEV